MTIKLASGAPLLGSMTPAEMQREIVKLRAWQRARLEDDDAQRAENERLRVVLEDAVDTLEAMDPHTDNPLYDRLRVALEQPAKRDINDLLGPSNIEDKGQQDAP